MTRTVAFGTTKRENHDARAFYQRQLEIASIDLTEVPNEVPGFGNIIVNRSSELMHEVPTNSVALMVTSPPYHVGKEYDTDETLTDYLTLFASVMQEVYRVLEPGGRAVVNAAGLGRRPYVPLHHYFTDIMQHLGFIMRGEIIWVKGKGANGSIAVGTFGSAKNPVLRDLHEYLLVFSKHRMDRAKKGKDTIEKDAFLENALSVWYMRPESAKRVGHPAPFPVELPRRLIEFYTFEDDLVLDPFMGVGTTCVAAVETNRRFIGYDTSADYCEKAEARIDRALEVKGNVR